MMIFVEAIRARRILSFGAEAGLDIALKDLNVLIGANSSGKSNLISLLSLLRATPKDLSFPINAGGGVREWLWKRDGAEGPAEIDVGLHCDEANPPWKYNLSFREERQRLALVDEHLTDGNGKVVFARSSEALPAAESVLAARRGEAYPEITRLADAFRQIRIYSDWHFAPHTSVRQGSSSGLPSDFLFEEDAANLAMVIQELEHLNITRSFREYMVSVNPRFESLSVRLQGGTVQLYVREAGLASAVPASRLSQGTLQLLCLLSVLLHPHPPKLVCLEEPEKGLHPDVLLDLAKLLREASKRMQLVVTTHSEVLVDCLTDEPESVIVCDKEDGQTTMQRLSSEDLRDWLKHYSLGQLWSKGTLGGNRWG